MDNNSPYEEALENIRKGEALLAEVREMVEDFDAYCIRMGVSAEVLRAARAMPTTPERRAEIDRQVEEINAKAMAELERSQALKNPGQQQGPEISRQKKIAKRPPRTMV